MRCFFLGISHTLWRLGTKSGYLRCVLGYNSEPGKIKTLTSRWRQGTLAPMPGKPYQSKLNPYLQEIHRLRSQTPPVSYQEIARILHEKYGVAVSPNGIFSFVKARSRPRAVYAIAPAFVAHAPGVETGANRRLRGFPFGSHLHSGVPARERRTPVPVQHLDSDLQQQMGAGFGPAHRLLFHKPSADHLVDG